MLPNLNVELTRLRPRTICDLPVFPWITHDASSRTLRFHCHETMLVKLSHTIVTGATMVVDCNREVFLLSFDTDDMSASIIPSGCCVLLRNLSIGNIGNDGALTKRLLRVREVINQLQCWMLDHEISENFRRRVGLVSHHVLLRPLVFNDLCQNPTNVTNNTT